MLTIIKPLSMQDKKKCFNLHWLIYLKHISYIMYAIIAKDTMKHEARRNYISEIWQ